MRCTRSAQHALCVHLTAPPNLTKSTDYPSRPTRPAIGVASEQQPSGASTGPAGADHLCLQYLTVAPEARVPNS